MLRNLEKKETRYMRLQRHKIGIDDFELLTFIGKGAFGEFIWNSISWIGGFSAGLQEFAIGWFSLRLRTGKLMRLTFLFVQLNRMLELLLFLIHVSKSYLISANLKSQFQHLLNL